MSRGKIVIRSWWLGAMESYGKLLINIIPNKQRNVSKLETELAVYVNTFSQGHKFLKAPLVTPRYLGQHLVCISFIVCADFQCLKFILLISNKQKRVGASLLFKHEYAHNAKHGHLQGLCCTCSHQFRGGKLFLGVGLSLISPSCCLFRLCSFCDNICGSLCYHLFSWLLGDLTFLS